MSKLLADYLTPYVPKEEGLKFFAWDNLMFGAKDNETPKVHYQLVDTLLTRHHLFSAMCFRGFAKTSIMSHKMPLYVAMDGGMPNFGNVMNAVLVSDTFDQADGQLQSCMAYYQSSDKLQSFLNLVKRKEGSLLFENNRGQEFYISARGAGQSFRGTNYKGQRPQWIIGDDLLNDDILYNKELNKKLIKWWSSVVMKAIDVNRFKVTVIGTPLLEDDLISMLVNSPSYHSVKFPAMQEFPVPKSQIVSAWADRFTPNKLWEMWTEAEELGTQDEFYREMQLQVVTDDTRVFKKEWFVDYKYVDIKKHKHKYNFFTTMDLAVSQKESADYTVVMTIAVNGNNDWFICRVDHKRMNPSEVLDILFSHIRQFRPLEVRAEKAALQQVLGHFINERMIKENTHFLYNPLEANSKMSKEYRILSLQPKMKARKIYFPDDISHDGVMELKHELLGFTKTGSTTKHDDLADTLANFMDDGFVVSPTDYGSDDYDGGIDMKEYDSTVF